jgi:zeta-carotene desaturase
VDLHEARPFLGGRATSFPLAPAEPDSERIDNCQHILLRCCTNLLDFYRRCGVLNKIRFFDEYCFVEPGGRVSRLKPGLAAFFHFGVLGARDKLAVAAGLRAMRRERGRADLDAITFGAWLTDHHQTERAIQRFWTPVIVSALNEEPARASAAPAFQVFLEGFLSGNRSYEMGVPAAPLGELYSAALERRLGHRVRVHLRSALGPLEPASGQADYYVSAVPFERVAELAPCLDLDLERFEHSPITGIHLWMDREATPLPQAALLDRTIQWMFRKSERHYQLVVSASRPLVPLSRQQIIDLAWEEFREFFPAAHQARLERAHVIKEMRATFSAVPGLEAARPGAVTKFHNLFLAGDWTRTGWPATMEGAVRSGYLAAEAVAQAAGRPARFLV